MSHNKLGAALLAALLLTSPACATGDEDGADGADGAVSAISALSGDQEQPNPDGAAADEALPADTNPDGSAKDPAEEVPYVDTLTGQARDNYLAKEACLEQFAGDDAALWACIDAINPAPPADANPDGSPADGGDKQPPAEGDVASNPDGSPVDPADWCVGLDGADLSACQLKQSCYVQSQGDAAAYEACVASISL